MNTEADIDQRLISIEFFLSENDIYVTELTTRIYLNADIGLPCAA